MQVMRRKSSMGVVAANIENNRLQQAADRFDVFKAKLKQLRNALRAHHTDLVRSEASRTKVVQALRQVGNDSSDSPMLELVCGGEISYAAIHEERSRDMSVRLKEYQVELISYIANWEGTVTTRIATELRHVDSLFKTFVRYYNKVESLKATAEKKKTIKDSDLEKINRNESKLRTARKEYRRNLVSTTLLIEEISDRGWKDLLPLMIRMITFDFEASTAAADRMSRLVSIRREMEELAERFEMNEDAIRFGRIETLLENDAMEFVRPENMQDIDSIQASVASYIPPAQRLRSKVRSSTSKPPSEAEDYFYEDNPSDSDNDSACPIDEKQGTLAQVHPNVECSIKGIELNASAFDKAAPESLQAPDLKALYVKKPSAPMEEELDDQGSIINYPTSIYLKVDGKMLPLDDDETTLTPYPDMASI
jgi:predicted RNA-binding protein with PUA domain